MGGGIHLCSIHVCVRTSWVLTGFYYNCGFSLKSNTLHLLTDGSSECSQTTDFEKKSSCLPLSRKVMFQLITKENNKTM